LLPPIITLLRPKCTNFDFVSATGASYSVPPDPLPVFKGPTSNGKNGRGRTTGKVQGGEEKEERGWRETRYRDSKEQYEPIVWLLNS